MPRIGPDGSVFSYRDMIKGKLKTFLVTERDASGRKVCDSCVILGFYTDPNFALVQDKDRRLIFSLLLRSALDTISVPAVYFRHHREERFHAQI